MEIKCEITFSGEIEGISKTGSINEVLDLIADFHRCGHVPNGIVNIKRGVVRLHTSTISTSVCDPETLAGLYLKNPNAPKRELQETDELHFILESWETDPSRSLTYHTDGFEARIKSCNETIFWKAIREMHEFRFQSYCLGQLVFQDLWGRMRFKVNVPNITEWDISKIWNDHIQPNFENLEGHLNELQEVINSLEF